MKKYLGITLLIAFLSIMALTNDNGSPSPSPPISTTTTTETISPYEQEYLVFLQGHIDKVASIMDRFAYQFGNYSYTEPWIKETVALLIELDGLIRDAYSQPVPPRYKEAHHHYLNAMDEYQYIVTDLPEAVDHQDLAALEKIKRHIEFGNFYLDKAVDLATTN